MRVVLTTDAVGGVWTFTRELSEGLLLAGCDVALVCIGPSPQPAQAEWLKEMESVWHERFLFRACDVPLEWMQGNERAGLAVVAVHEIACEFRAEIVHASQFCVGSAPGDLPVVITAHSDVLSWAANCRAGALEPSPWLSRYRALVRSGLAGASAAVAPTRWMLEALLANFELPDVQRVIPNGRALRDPSTHARKLQAVTCGRLWDEGKNLQVLGKTVSPFPLLVAGQAAHEDAAMPLLAQGIEMVGVLSEAEVFALLQSSAVYLCTSRYEPFGLAVLEAALCGCAIVANDIPSLREVWGENALYFRDADGLSACLSRLGEDSTLLLEFQQRSRNRARSYTPEASTASYLELYRQLLDARGLTRAA